MEEMPINRRAFIKKVTASKLLLTNPVLFSHDTISMIGEASPRNNHLFGLSLQNASPKSAMVSIYGLGYTGLNSIQYIATNVDIPNVKLKTIGSPVEEGHLNFLISDYSELMGANLKAAMTKYDQMENVKILVVGVPLDKRDFIRESMNPSGLLNLSDIFDTVLLVPDMRLTSERFGPRVTNSESDLFQKNSYLANVTMEIAYKMLDGGFMGPDLLDLQECFRPNSIGVVGTGIVTGSNRGERASKLAELSLGTLITDPLNNCKFTYIISSSIERHPFDDMKNAIEYVDRKLWNKAEYIYGHCCRKQVNEKFNSFRVMLISTGCFIS